jgi:hypothetical protein
VPVRPTLLARIAPDGLARGLGGPLAVAVAAGVVLSLVGAFGTGGVPLVPRTLYWIGVICLGTVVALTARPLVAWTGWLEGHLWAEAAVVVLSIVTVGAPLVWLVSAASFGRAVRGGELEAFVLPVAVLAVAMTSLNYALQRAPRVTHAAPVSAPGSDLADAAMPVPPRFDARLPSHLRGAEIHAVSAEDHYLRVHTDRGQALILLRLADAVAELEGVEGAQTHRSWWVAKDAILDARRGEGRATLSLKGGIAAPVSRTYARSLREAGWFG